MPNATRIELPRPAIIAALGALILAATFVITKGKTDGGTPAASTGTPAVTTTTTTAPATTAKPAKPKVPPVKPGPGLPANVAQALDRHQVIVLFFYEPAGADDQATRAAVNAVRGAGPGVRLFSDTVAHISDYRRAVGSLGVSQSPAMVVIDRQRRAKLFQGFLDAGTIRQSVRDAL